MKVLSTGTFSSHRSQIEAFKVCPLNMVLILEVINMCWQIKDAHFILSVSKNITINDSFLLNVGFFSDFGMILRIFSQSFTIVSFFFIIYISHDVFSWPRDSLDCGSYLLL